MKKTFAILGLAATLAACGTTSKTKDNTGIHNIDSVENITIPAKQNEIIKISTETNVTTGYNWHINESLTSKDITVVSEKYEAYPNTPKDIVGAPSILIYELKPTTKGEHKFVIEYKRGWESNPPASTKTITLKVN